MARYIDADELYKEVTEKYRDITAGQYPFNIVAYDMAQLVKNAPTADVVPKSEAENYRKIAEHQQSVSMRRYFEIKQLKEELAKAKQEVAREIFEEIDLILFEYNIILNGESGLLARFVELKKKYTESEGKE